MRNFIMLVVSSIIILAIGIGPQGCAAGVADNLEAPTHEVLRMTATECGPYDAVPDSDVALALRNHTGQAVATYFPEAKALNYEAVVSHCTPTEIGNRISKLGLKFGAVLRIVETDDQGSFLTLLVLDPEHATFFALILQDTGGAVVVVMDLVHNPKESNG
jgi:hypothetical protein